MRKTGPILAPFCVPIPPGMGRKSSCAQNLPDQVVRPAPSVEQSARRGITRIAWDEWRPTGH
jgi:hypothetical protein